MKVIDLFCGCGGFSQGFKEMGYQIILGVDNWGIACESFASNHNCEVWNKDIRQINALPKADVIIASPPCQTFSEANPSRENDPELIYYSLYLIAKSKPKFWVMEEVEEAKNYIPRSIPVQFIQANHHGNNLHRRRRMFAGNAPQVMAERINPLKFGTPTSKWRASGNFHADYPKDIKEIRGHDPTVNDKKMDMGFPKDYILCGTEAQQHKQLGNAVCVDVARAIAKAINEVMLERGI